MDGYSFPMSGVGQKWGKVPHGLQRISAELDPPKTAL